MTNFDTSERHLEISSPMKVKLYTWVKFLLGMRRSLSTFHWYDLQVSDMLSDVKILLICLKALTILCRVMDVVTTYRKSTENWWIVWPITIFTFKIHLCWLFPFDFLPFRYLRRLRTPPHWTHWQSRQSKKCWFSTAMWLADWTTR